LRLWSIHPKYLDAKGLVALWREGLLAQHVLAGKTRGYQHHPQLERFKNAANPQGAIASYLRYVAREAESRKYRFDRNRILNRYTRITIPVTEGQLVYEFEHLLRKIKNRNPTLFLSLNQIRDIDAHPLLIVIPGDVADWEVQ
jgi:hypothetical protein